MDYEHEHFHYKTKEDRQKEIKIHRILEKRLEKWIQNILILNGILKRSKARIQIRFGKMFRFLHSNL